ncbi:MAG TPA: xanthine dehydrogenase family protein molybdopterin-binding subunit [Cyclobacteriaceae bacterium]|nr:xanthine dehydrogenase family protein molybdopterin-binding subunit [Cyclobacteriaceae bacterium]
MQNTEPLSRRHFLRQTGLSGFALTIGAYLPSFGKAAVKIIDHPTADTLGIELMSWISIDGSGNVTIFSSRSEMGQGTYQSMPQMIAEELEVNLARVNIKFAPANPKKFGPQPQEGSFSVRGWYKQLLQTGASAREMLIEAATHRWKVPASECYAENGQVIHRPSGKKLGYGDLVEEASRLTPPQNVKLKERKEYKLIGKSLPRQDIPLKTNGSAVFGLDKKLPGMLYAVVERNPRFRGKVKSFDDSATKAIPGVKHVFTVQRAVFANLYEGVAVVADTLWGAMQGRKVLKVEWDDQGFEHVGSEELSAQMLENLKKSGPSEKFEAALQNADKKIEAIYETPYESHSCMEPLNCIAHVRDQSIEIGGPIQEANWIQADLSERMGVPIENVTVNMTFLGGGFGRKAFTDYPHEAALISKKINGPVQVVWTREDDMTAGPFRTGACYSCRGGLDKDGQILAFQTITAAQWIGQEWSADPYPDPGQPTYNSGPMMEGLLSPYQSSIPHLSFGGVGTRAPIPVMWWRSVYASTNGFACESFIDELANAAGKDPLDFRRSHLREARYQALITKLEAISGWKMRGKNEGWGVAITECFGSISGHIVKVSHKPDGKIKIDKVIALMDCGWYVNPDIIRAQVEGSIVMGLGAAIKHETHFKDGKAVERNFDTYKMPRISDIPEIEVHVMDNDEKPGGVGEPGLPPFAPALCNAIFDLTGKRIRKLPFDLDKVSQT